MRNTMLLLWAKKECERAAIELKAEKKEKALQDHHLKDYDLADDEEELPF
jgi:hypothetical protein